MSLILDALRKAREMTKKKPPSPAPRATFRFGRPTRSQRMRRFTLLYVLPGMLLLSVAGYTVNFWQKRLARPKVATATPSVAVTEPPAPPAETLPDMSKPPSISISNEIEQPKPISSVIPGINAVGVVTLTLKEKALVEISVPPGHRWYIVDPAPDTKTWKWTRGEKNSDGNLAIKFEVIPPATEVQLQNVIAKCGNPLCN